MSAARKPARRKPSTVRTETSPPFADCLPCMDQMVGKAGRCTAHNPTPEMRAEQPERYPLVRFSRRVSKPSDGVARTA